MAELFTYKRAFSYRGEQPAYAEVIPLEGKDYRDGIVQVLNAHGHNGKAIIGCEIGVDRGDTTKHLLDAFPQLKMYGIDPWLPNSQMARRHHTESTEGDYAASLSRLESYGDRVTIIRGDSHIDNTKIPNDLDFIFIDGDHSYHGVRVDSKISYTKLKWEGLLMGHDYGDRAFWEVTMWVNWLIECAKWPIKTVGDTGLWYIKKSDIAHW